MANGPGPADLLRYQARLYQLTMELSVLSVGAAKRAHKKVKTDAGQSNQAAANSTMNPEMDASASDEVLFVEPGQRKTRGSGVNDLIERLVGVDLGGVTENGREYTAFVLDESGAHVEDEEAEDADDEGEGDEGELGEGRKVGRQGGREGKKIKEMNDEAEQKEEEEEDELVKLYPMFRGRGNGKGRKRFVREEDEDEIMNDV